MRLLVVTQYFWPEDFRINEVVSELSRRGHQVTVLTGKPNYPAGELLPAYVQDPGAFSTYAGARVVRVPMRPRGRGSLSLLLNYLSFAASATCVGIFRLRGERFDAMFVSQYSPVLVGIPAIVLRRLKRLPIAFWILDLWPESLSAVGAVKSKAVLRLVGGLVSYIYAHCDIILSPSRSMMPQIATHCDPAKRIEYFPNWTESAYVGAPAEAAAEVPLRSGSFDVMFAGNIGEAQDFPTILDTAERLKERADIRWLVVGDGRMTPWVRSEIARRGLEDRVVMLGRFPAERMPSFFCHADALLVSLKSDPVFAMTSPGKIQSYLAFGRPVLAMLDGEGAAVIEEARAGLTSPAGNAARLADNVVRLAALSAQERASLGTNGAAYAEREFSRSRLVDRLETWLGDIVCASHTKGAA